MNRRRETSLDECTDVCEEKINSNDMYPFALVLRMRVTQIVCGISTLLMGSVAIIEEKSEFNMGIGIPAGISTILAAVSIVDGGHSGGTGKISYLRHGTTVRTWSNNSSESVRSYFYIANSIYCSRGFDGYRPSACKSQPWARFRFLGPNFRIAGVHVILWGTTIGLLLAVCFNALNTLSAGQISSTLSVLAGVECALSVAVFAALVAIIWIDVRYDPD